MTRRALAALLSLVLVISSTGAPLAAQAPVEPASLVQPAVAAEPNADIAAVLASATQVTAGDAHTCALTSDGGVKCWGRNNYGQLGDGTTTVRTTPVDVSGLASGVRSLSAGGDQTCALTDEGGVKCWGRNNYGQLGDGTTTSRYTPVDVSGLAGSVSALAVGYSHTCAATSEGGVKCWGNNGSGQLGDGTTTTRNAPVDVSGLTSGVTTVAAGRNHTCALTIEGSTTANGISCWGNNDSGQLGNGTTEYSSMPVKVTGLASAVAAVAGGGYHTCAVTSEGGVECWGANWYGQLGNGTTESSSMPVHASGLTNGVSAVAAGYAHTCALLSGGEAKCWGDNEYGQLGDGTSSRVARTAPANVSELASGVSALATGEDHTCASMRGGAVRCWGRNNSGQLGDGTTAYRTTALEVNGLPSGVRALVAGYAHACALTSGDAVKCWGHNDDGQLGNGTQVSRYTPVNVSGLASGVVAMAAGSRHTCAVTSAGGVKCWGDNWDGQLGDGTNTDRYTPVDVSGLGTSVVALAAGGNHTCALTSGGGVKCWGGNYEGQLGDGTTESRHTPVDVSGLTSGVNAVTARGSHTCASTSRGDIKCWGDNELGQLGDGTTIDRATPVDVRGLASGATAVTASYYHTCALTSEGGAKCWGDNYFGQLGDGTLESRYAPVDVSGMASGVSALAAGEPHTCALTSGGAIKCWGGNYRGELGDGTIERRTTPVEVNGLASGATALAAAGWYTCAVTNGDVKCWGDNVCGQLGVNPGWAPVGVVGFEEGSELLSLTVSPPSAPADNTASATVTLAGGPVGHRVRFFTALPGGTLSPGDGIVAADGRLTASIRSSAAGDAKITAQDLTTGTAFAVSATVRFAAPGGASQPPSANSGPFAITDVRSQYPLDGAYLQGIQLDNRVEVTVDWAGTIPGRVDFQLNGQVFSESAIASRTSHSFDMGSDLQAGDNELRITAYDSLGIASGYRSYALRQVAAPAWFLAGISGGILLLPAPGESTGKAAVKYGFVYPYTDLGLFAENFGVPGTRTGLPVRIEGALSIPLTCPGEVKGSLKASQINKFKFLGAEIAGSLEGSFSSARAPSCSLLPPAGSWKLEIEAEKNLLKRTWLDMLMYYNYALYVSVDGMVEVLNLDAYVEQIGQFSVDGSVAVEVGSGIYSADSEPNWAFRDFEVGGGLGIKGTLSSNIAVAEVKLYAGGKGRVYFVRPGLVTEASDWSWDRVEVTGEAGAKFRVGWFIWEDKGSIEWRYPPVALSAHEGLPRHMAAQWRLIPHPSVRGYATFRGATTTNQPFLQRAGAASPGVATPPTDSGVLVSNVYTYTEPALALSTATGQALLLWTHDDLARPVGQSHEIQFSRWDGATWSTPAGVTSDDKLDAAPQVAWAGDGKGVAVWQRLDDVLPSDATWDEEAAKKLEITTATYDPATGAWSTPVLLTDNASLDMTPVLARNPAGNLLTAWRENDAGMLSGTITDTDKIMISFYGSAWSTPAVAAGGIPGLVDMAAGYGQGAATLAFTRYISATGETTPTLQLLASTWNGSSWSAPAQLTDDALGHTDPQVVYNAGNQPLLVWLAGGTLTLRNLATAAEQQLVLPAAVGGVDEFRVVQDTAGNLAAVFTAQGTQRDLFVAFFDQTHVVWSNPLPLTSDRASEGYPAPGLDSTGQLLMAYASTAITDEVRTTTDPDTGEPITYSMPVEGQTDLLTLSHIFTRNLTLTDGGLAVTQTHPAPGASITISATVTNTADLALTGVAVSFYDGDPAAGGSLIGTSTLPAPLPGGMTATLTVPYTVPATGGVRTLYAVADPVNALVEADETDNTAALAAFGPDLVLDPAYAEPWGGSEVGLVAVVRNKGTTTSPAASLAFYREAITGMLTGSQALPVLATGEAVTITVPWNYGSLPAGSHRLVAVANAAEADFPEVDTGNNSASLMLDVQADLAVSPLYTWSQPLVDGTVMITTTVYNLGSVASETTTLDLWINTPFTDTGHLTQLAVPPLPPAGQAVLTTTWPSVSVGEHTLYAGVNFDRSQAEISWANNVASISVATPMTGVKIARSPTGVTLTWTHLGSSIDHYAVYRAAGPYFNATDGDAIRLPDVPPPAEGTAVSTTDSAALLAGSAAHYLVVPVARTGIPQPVSNAVGVVSFGLAQGGE